MEALKTAAAPARRRAGSRPDEDFSEGWFERARTEKFQTAEEAARAARVSTRLIWLLEAGSVTAPELARRIGRALSLSRAQIQAITCQKSVERRRQARLEALKKHNGADQAILSVIERKMKERVFYE